MIFVEIFVKMIAHQNVNKQISINKKRDTNPTRKMRQIMLPRHLLFFLILRQ